MGFFIELATRVLARMEGYKSPQARELRIKHQQAIDENWPSVGDLEEVGKLKPLSGFSPHLNLQGNIRQASTEPVAGNRVQGRVIRGRIPHGARISLRSADEPAGISNNLENTFRGPGHFEIQTIDERTETGPKPKRVIQVRIAEQGILGKSTDFTLCR